MGASKAPRSLARTRPIQRAERSGCLSPVARAPLHLPCLRPVRIGRPAHAGPTPRRCHLRAHPVIVLPALLAERAVRAAGNADGRTAVTTRRVEGRFAIRTRSRPSSCSRASYRRSAATASTYRHFGHSNVRRFASGLSGSMRTIHIGVPHNRHGGRSLGAGKSRWGVPGIATNPSHTPTRLRALRWCKSLIRFTVRDADHGSPGGWAICAAVPCDVLREPADSLPP
jgi:hypothetical protein